MLQAKSSIAERIVEKVARATGTDALDQPPLYDVVDPDTLDSLVEGMSNGEVAFVYAGHEVTVESDGTITLEERPSGYPAAGTAVGDN